MEQITGGYAKQEPIVAYGVFDDDKPIAIYALIESGKDAPEVCLYIVPEAKPSAIRTWREIKKGLRLLNELGYAKLYAEAGQKYLNKLGVSLWA